MYIYIYKEKWNRPIDKCDIVCIFIWASAFKVEDVGKPKPSLLVFITRIGIIRYALYLYIIAIKFTPRNSIGSCSGVYGKNTEEPWVSASGGAVEVLFTVAFLP